MKPKPILSAKSDFFFKLLFGNEHNVDILANFLSAILDLPVEEFAHIQLLDTFLKKEHEDDKFTVIDVNLRTVNGIEIMIEMQVINKKDYEKRSVYNTSRRLITQLGAGEPYIKLRQTISINIIDFNLFPYEKYHSTYWLIEETEGYRLTDIYRIDYLELRKAKSLSENDPKKLWMDFINAETEEELAVLLQKSEVFQKPVAEVIRLSGDAAIRAEYEARQQAIRDRQAELDYAWNEGRNEGRNEGWNEAKLEIAKKLLKIDTNPTTIVEVTELPLDVIQKLAKEIQ